MKVDFQTSFKNAHKASFLARDIASFFNKGSALEGRVETVLNHLREWTGVRSLKHLDNQRVEAFVNTLQEKVASGELSRKTAENYISSLNRIIDYVNLRLNKDLEVVSAREWGLSRGSFEFVNRAVSQETHERFLNFLSQKEDLRAQALFWSVQLQREFGLRLRESIGIKIETIERALETNVLHLTRVDLTKNGREREIAVLNDDQRKVLQGAYDFMKEHGLFSLAPGSTLKEQCNYAYSIQKEFNREYGENFSFHQERHAFAQSMISQGVDRATVSQWLGHNREEITRIYAR